MNWQFHPLILLSLAGGIIAAAMVRYGLLHRERPSVRIFASTELLVVVMALAHIVQMSSMDVGTALLASKVQTAAITTITVLFVVAVLPSNMRRSTASAALLVALCVVPVVTVHNMIFASVPNALYESISMDLTAGYARLVLVPGPWFWVQTVYSYGLLLAGLLLVGERLVRLPSPYRRRPMLALTELFVAFLGHIAVNLGVLQGLSSDLLVSATIIMLAIAVWMTFFYSTFDILPLARDQVLQHLPMGVITLDTFGRVLDANEAAVSYLGISLRDLVHRPADEALSVIPQLVAALRSNSAPVELAEGDSLPQPYEVSRIEVKSQRGEIVGMALILRDISAEIEARQRLRELASYIPVCAWCGKARTPGGSWEPLATWLRKQGGMIVSHGICEECRQRYEEDPNWKPAT